MGSQIEEIKNRTDVVELIGSYIRLQKAGANFKAACPFHNERTPSFNVSPARQIWHCFGCGKGGDIFQFVMDIEGVEFYDALRTLADRAGIVLREEDREARNNQMRQYALLEEAAKFFEKNLADDESLGYLKNRGLLDETIKEFRLGYARNEWRELSSYLKGKKFIDEEIEKSGLVVIQEGRQRAAEGPRYYDRFRGRIIFPIFNYSGRVVAFGGRIFEDAFKKEETVGAKYVNSPETALYQKSKTLYGLNKAKTEILKQNECVLVEGYMDTIMSWQAGVKNVVASSGTALSEDQVKILRRISDKLIAAFDMDLAGENAARRGIDLAIAEGFNVRVLKLENIKDPADAVKKDPEIWKSAVLNARHIVQFYIDSVLGKFPAESPEAKSEFQKKVLPAVAALSSELERAHWIKEISNILKIKEEIIWNALKSTKTQIKIAGIEANINKLPKGRKALLEERILSILAKFPALSDKMDVSIHSMIPKENRAAFFAELFLNGIVEAEAELMACERELKKEHLRERMSEISRQIGVLEKQGSGNTNELVVEFQNLSQKLSQL